MNIDINKKHDRRAAFAPRDRTRRKVWWGRAAGGSGSCAVIRLKPKLAMTRLFVAVGGAGQSVNVNGTTQNIFKEEAGGMPSGIGTAADYSGNILVCPAGAAFSTYTGGKGGGVPVLNADGAFDVLSAVRSVAGNDGTAATLYNSYSAPTTTAGASVYDGSARGYGAGGYNAGNANFAGVGGYVKIKIV